MIPKHCIVGLGEILWDILPDGKQLGGAPANFAYHAKALKGQSYVVSSVGGDELGREVFEQLDEIHLSHEFIAVHPKHPTGTATVKLDSQGSPDFTIHDNVAWDHITFSSGLKDLAARTDAVCFGSLAQRSEVSRKTIYSFLESVSPDCLCIFDVNLRQSFFSKAIISESLKCANALKLNDRELLLVSELLSITGSESEIMSKLLNEFQLKLVALTKGREGSRLISPEGDSYYPSRVIEEVVDTVGAGDAFMAAVAVGLLETLPLETIHKNATSVAAKVCMKKGATPTFSKYLVEVNNVERENK
jgi:fructokinase